MDRLTNTNIEKYKITKEIIDSTPSEFVELHEKIKNNILKRLELETKTFENELRKIKWFDVDKLKEKLSKLAEYENTGLTPKEVEELKHELAEYENIGTVKEFRDEKLARALLIPRLLKEKKELKHELEVCKRALKSACKWIDSSAWLITDGTAEDWERAKQTTNDFYLDQARKELKGGSDDKN